MGWLGWSVLVLALLLAGFAVFALWAVKTGSVATLDKIDARFSRARPAELVTTARFGEDWHQKLRLYAPAGQAPPGGFPLVAFYHGGGWHSGDPYDYDFVARALAARGYATALIGYRLNEEGKFPAMVEDSAAGLAKALALAPGHRIDPRRVVLVGHSAGAYNAAMLALDPRWLQRAGVPQSVVAGLVGLSGPYDFYPFRWPSAKLSFGSWPSPKETQPIAFARADASPTLLLTGTADETVRPRNTVALAKALRAAGARPEVVQIEGMSHGGPVVTLARPFDRDARVSNALFAFLGRVFPAEPASSPVQPAKH